MPHPADSTCGPPGSVLLVLLSVVLLVSAPAPACDQDTNGDDVVGIDDLVNVILDWGTNGSGHGGDVDGSGLVDVDDVVDVVLAWGRCPSTDPCLADGGCAPGEYCQKTMGDCDGPGTCTAFGGGCGGEWNPVCGCDGETYSNAGCAIAAGVNVAYAGECEGTAR